ncbi:MAG: hypothetical protein ACKON7_05455 [Planctomycetaceae bacterium]
MPPASSAGPASRAALDALKLDRLRELVRAILPHNAFYAAKLERLDDPAALASLAGLADWPFTYKEELVAAGRPGPPTATCGPTRPAAPTAVRSPCSTRPTTGAGGWTAGG